MIGTKARWMTGALVSAGLMLGSVSAAEARPRWDRGYDRGWDRHHHRHGDDGFGVGDAIGVAALVGAVAIVANSLSKDRKVRDPITGGEYDAPPPSAGTDYGADVADAPAPVDEGDFSDIAAQDDAMTDACARAAARIRRAHSSGKARPAAAMPKSAPWPAPLPEPMAAIISTAKSNSAPAIAPPAARRAASPARSAATGGLPRSI